MSIKKRSPVVVFQQNFLTLLTWFLLRTDQKNLMYSPIDQGFCKIFCTQRNRILASASVIEFLAAHHPLYILPAAALGPFREDQGLTAETSSIRWKLIWPQWLEPGKSRNKVAIGELEAEPLSSKPKLLCLCTKLMAELMCGTFAWRKNSIHRRSVGVYSILSSCCLSPCLPHLVRMWVDPP